MRAQTHALLKLKGVPLIAGAVIGAWLAATPASLLAQNVSEKLYSSGDGRIHGAPVLPVTYMELKPDAVQTINLHPGFHTILEFPYPVARVDGGDDRVLMAEVIGNKVILKAADVDVLETSMSVILGDADLTFITYLVRADSTQPMSFAVRFTDSAVEHINRATERIASELSKNIDRRVEVLAEENLRRKMLFGPGAITINKRKFVEDNNGYRFGIIVEQAEQMPGPNREPRLYIRYRLVNETPRALHDAHLVVRFNQRKRKWGVLSETTSVEIPGVRDERTSLTIPPGESIRGLLIMDGVVLNSSNEWLSIEAVSLGGKVQAMVDRVLVGSDK